MDLDPLELERAYHLAPRPRADSELSNLVLEGGKSRRPKNPPPKWGTEAIVPLAIDYIREKAAEGEQKYGMPLMAHNGRSSLLDAMEEARDLFLYLFQACREQGLV